MHILASQQEVLISSGFRKQKLISSFENKGIDEGEDIC